MVDELYSAKAGFSTKTTASIEPGDTTIPVESTAEFAEAPNLATLINLEEKRLETVLYGDKDGTNLLDCTRGVEGSPQSWAAETEIGRFHTAHDQNKLISKIKELTEKIQILLIRVVSSDPPGFSQEEFDGSVVITFDRDIAEGDTWDDIKILDDEEQEEAITKSIDGAELTLSIDGEVDAQTDYDVIIPAGSIKEVNGVGVLGETFTRTITHTKSLSPTESGSLGLKLQGIEWVEIITEEIQYQESGSLGLTLEGIEWEEVS